MARQPSLSPESRRIIQNERRNIQRQAASAAEQRLAAAREEMRNAATRETTRVHANNENALTNGIKTVVSTVASSYGVLPQIDIRTNWHQRELVAWTDFKKVVIKYPHTLIPVDSVGSWKPEVLRNLYADVKGISYHEIGHILFTVPFQTLLHLAEGEGWTIPLVENGVINNQTLYRPIASTQNLHQFWNILEDQRMESAMVSSSPIMADYFTTMVLTHIANERAVHTSSTWLLLVGRRYLPRKVRLWFQDSFAQVHGIDKVHEAKEIVYRYMRSTTPTEMMKAVVDLFSLAQSISASPPSGFDEHVGGVAQSEEQALETLQRSADKSDAKDDTDQSTEPQSSAAPQEEVGGEEGEGDEVEDSLGDPSDNGDSSSSDGQADEQDTPTPATGNGGESQSDAEQGSTPPPQQSNGGGLEEPRDFLYDTLQDLIDQARESQAQDSSLDEAVRATYETANSSNLAMPRTQRIHREYGDNFLATAESVAQGLEDALRVFTAENTPIWQNRQSRGVIDPFAYRTRQSGSTDYRRLYSDGDIGTDISVVIMLDTSGSMHGSDESLGLAAYATKRACDSVGVPCTVMTFDYDSRIVWTASESPEPICLSADGGTNPFNGLSALEEFTFDKADQLVVLMTDGVFGGGVTLNRFHAPGRHFLGLGYGSQVSKYYLDNIGFHESYVIKDLLTIPQIVANFLAAHIQ